MVIAQPTTKTYWAGARMVEKGAIGEEMKIEMMRSPETWTYVIPSDVPKGYVLVSLLVASALSSCL